MARKQVCQLVPGDIMSGSGEKIIRQPNVDSKTPSGKMMVYLEGKYGRRCAIWGKHTVVGVEEMTTNQKSK